ncbi:hypothetical protein VTG60DRAFT_4736 [Thermothelomyces hinnuleus]
MVRLFPGDEYWRQIAESWAQEVSWDKSFLVILNVPEDHRRFRIGPLPSRRGPHGSQAWGVEALLRARFYQAFVRVVVFSTRLITTSGGSVIGQCEQFSVGGGSAAGVKAPLVARTRVREARTSIQERALMSAGWAFVTENRAG